MKILVIGASQGTGALCVGLALERGHEVTAFARTPAKLAIEHARLKKVPGDFHDAESVARVVAGQDAVIVTAAAGSLKGFKEKPDFFSSGTRHVIAAMKAGGSRRLVVLSALFVGDSRPLANFFLRLVMVDGLLKLPYADHEVQERLVRESGLDWVIARPSRLTNGPAGGRYTKTTRIEPVPKAISRADVAGFLVDSCEQSTFLGQAVQMGG
jgi:putative NADH-flavin reductase